jgi:RAD51-like protein 2
VCIWIGGVPGIGKTQLGIQLAVDVHIPAELGGAEGHCIYIDTEGSFMPERVMEIGQSAVEHVQAMASDPDACTQEQQDAAQRFTIESIMERIFYFRVHDHVEQIALVIRLPELIAELKAKGIHIKLIVMDSITFHFRASHQFADMGQRTRLLSNMATQLMSIASENTLAVVLLNQGTTLYRNLKSP